jgi:hypothetical protein
MPGVSGWTVVYRGSRLQAEIIAAALAADGLDPQVFGDSAYSASIDFTDARLMVPDAQAATARRRIAEADRKASDPAAGEDV